MGIAVLLTWFSNWYRNAQSQAFSPGVPVQGALKSWLVTGMLVSAFSIAGISAHLTLNGIEPALYFRFFLRQMFVGVLSCLAVELLVWAVIRRWWQARIDRRTNRL